MCERELVQHPSFPSQPNFSLIVNLLRAQKLEHVHQLPSFFNTMKIDNEQGLGLGQMNLTPIVIE